MPAPRITLVLGTLNEKELGLTRLAKADENRHGCAARQRIVDLDRSARRQRSVKPRYSLVAAKPFELIHTSRRARCCAKKLTVSRVTDSSVDVISVSGCLPPNE